MDSRNEKKKKEKKTEQLESIELFLKIATIFWNVFSFFLFLDILYFLIIFYFCW